MTHHRYMMPIPIDEFLNDGTLVCDLYVRLSTEKFICIGKGGSSIDPERLKNYKGKAVTYLYIKRTDYVQHVKRPVKYAEVPVTPPEAEEGFQELVILKMAKPVFSNLRKSGFDPNIFEESQKIAEVAISVAQAKKPLFDILKTIAKTDDQFLAHCVAVSIMAPMLGLAMNWNSRPILEKLSLGGLLHDIGKTTLPEDFLTRPRDQFSHDEKVIYESHPEIGAQLLKTFRFVPQDVVTITQQHHEKADGMGFPMRLKDAKTHPLARVVSLANVFCEMIVHSKLNPNPRSVKEAVTQIETYQKCPYNREAFDALKMLCEGRDIMKAG